MDRFTCYCICLLLHCHFNGFGYRKNTDLSNKVAIKHIISVALLGFATHLVAIRYSQRH